MSEREARSDREICILKKEGGRERWRKGGTGRETERRKKGRGRGGRERQTDRQTYS